MHEPIAPKLRWMTATAMLCGGLVALSASPPAAAAEIARDRDGLIVHTLRSPYQAAPTQVKILLPEPLEPGRRYRVLYVLPVEAGDGDHYGDGLLEVRKTGLAQRHRLICVYPRFAQLPWFADHASDPGIRQESYLLRDVLPLVEANYPVQANAQGRLLLGFSKSGWGAYSLLLRHPDVFGKAAAWDAPLEERAPQRFGMGPIFGSPENFENYRISALLARQAPLLQSQTRLILTGYGNFRSQHVAAHERMTKLGIRHEYRDGPPRRHEWGSGWLPEAIELLAGPAE
jgi:hypothetical protein